MGRHSGLCLVVCVLALVLLAIVSGQENPDDQCAAATGRDDIACRSAVEYRSDVGFTEVCLAGHLYCSLKDDGVTCFATGITALDDTPCGNNKVCDAGACVDSSLGPETADSCPFGDQPGVIQTINTVDHDCASFIALGPYNCYNEEFQVRKCCATCEGFVLADAAADCTYGDMIDNCVLAECDQLTAVMLPNCCDTCAATIATTTAPPDPVTTAPPDPVTTPAPITDVTPHTHEPHTHVPTVPDSSTVHAHPHVTHTHNPPTDVITTTTPARVIPEIPEPADGPDGPDFVCNTFTCILRVQRRFWNRAFLLGARL